MYLDDIVHETEKTILTISALLSKACVIRWEQPALSTLLIFCELLVLFFYTYLAPA